MTEAEFTAALYAGALDAEFDAWLGQRNNGDTAFLSLDEGQVIAEFRDYFLEIQQ